MKTYVSQCVHRVDSPSDQSSQAFASRACTRSGFTIIELMVSIAVIGILSSLLLSAIVRARAASRLVTCQNNQRQLVVAFSNAADAEGGFPTGVAYLQAIYPYAEAQQLMEAIGDQVQSPTSGNLPSPSWLACPDDELVEIRWGDASYLQSDGIPGALGGPRGRGVYGVTDRVRELRAISDGLSNTILLSERLVSPIFSPDRAAVLTDAQVRSQAARYHFWFPDSIPVFDDLTPFVEECRFVTPAASQWYPVDRGLLLSRLWHHTSIGFNHVDSPNTASCYRGVRTSGEQLNPTITGSTPATSQHTGCVVAAKCDGSVKVVSDSIDAELWRALGTIRGNEAEHSL